MIELVIAIGIIITGLLVVVGLITRSIYVGTRAKNELIALSLAQEGIEAVRSIRDSNALEIQAKLLVPDDWDADIDGIPPDYTAIPISDFDYTASPDKLIRGVWWFDWRANDINSNDTNVYRYLDTGLYPGMYFQTLVVVGIPAGTSVDTGFNRIIDIVPLCSDNPDPQPLAGRANSCEEISPTALEKVGIQIVSQVRWTEGRTTQDVILTQNIYDWRK